MPEFAQTNQLGQYSGEADEMQLTDPKYF